jgi:hypothetical protein
LDKLSDRLFRLGGEPAFLIAGNVFRRLALRLWRLRLRSILSVELIQEVCLSFFHVVGSKRPMKTRRRSCARLSPAAATKTARL